jgi:hypothetical protein
MSMKKSSETIGNRTRDLPDCSAVPQPLRHRVPHIYRIPRRTVSQLKKRSFWVKPKGGMPETISTLWYSVTRLFSKTAARGEKCRSFDAIASPRPVFFPLSWKAVFFWLWQCSAGGAVYWDIKLHYKHFYILTALCTIFRKLWVCVCWSYKMLMKMHKRVESFGVKHEGAFAIYFNIYVRTCWYK